MALKIHSLMESAYDFDRALWSCPVHQEMPSATTVSRNMERAKARQDLISGFGARDIGPVSQFGDRLNERVAVDTRLSHAKILRGPFEDVGEVEFCGSAETDAPCPLGHESSIRRFRR